jgi:DNA-binding CsgD family transcriptional regulator
MKAVYIYTNGKKAYPLEPYMEIVNARLLDLDWKKPKVFYDGFTEGEDGWNDLEVLIAKGQVDGLMLFSLEAWASEERHRFLPVISKVLKGVPQVLVACAPSLGVMKGMKDMAKMEGLFHSTEYFSNMSSVSVKAGISKSKKTGGRPSLIKTDREFVQQVADLYNAKLSTKDIAARLKTNYNKVYRIIKNLERQA